MAYFHCLIGGGSSGGGYELTVTCDADFAGTTITCTDGVTTLTQTCPSASPYEVVFAIPNGGEWTVSGVIESISYSASVDIPDSLELHSIPEGSTVLPTDDIHIWLKCAGITDKSYTTLNEVLADSTTLLALMSDDNAVDYLVRSTTWASGLTADSTAMTDIGANNYCANTLLADSTWLTAICNSTYFESVLNSKIPTMTSNTTPSGVASASSEFQSGSSQIYYAWRAMDGTNTDSGDCWASQNNPTYPQWIQYQFTSAMQLNYVEYWTRNYNEQSSPKDVDLQAYDGNSWVTLKSNTSTVSAMNTKVSFVVGNNNKYTQYRLNIRTKNGSMPTYVAIGKLQFYGRVDV